MTLSAWRISVRSASGRAWRGSRARARRRRHGRCSAGGGFFCERLAHAADDVGDAAVAAHRVDGEHDVTGRRRRGRSWRRAGAGLGGHSGAGLRRRGRSGRLVVEIDFLDHRDDLAAVVVAAGARRRGADGAARRSSEHSLGFAATSASCDRRMPRLERVTLLFGTAISRPRSRAGPSARILILRVCRGDVADAARLVTPREPPDAAGKRAAEHTRFAAAAQALMRATLTRPLVQLRRAARRAPAKGLTVASAVSARARRARWRRPRVRRPAGADRRAARAPAPRSRRGRGRCGRRAARSRRPRRDRRRSRRRGPRAPAGANRRRTGTSTRVVTGSSVTTQVWTSPSRRSSAVEPPGRRPARGASAPAKRSLRTRLRAHQPGERRGLGPVAGDVEGEARRRRAGAATSTTRAKLRDCRRNGRRARAWSVPRGSRPPAAPAAQVP